MTPFIEHARHIEFAGRSFEEALGIARRFGFTDPPILISWEQPGLWLLRYRNHSPN